MKLFIAIMLLVICSLNSLNAQHTNQRNKIYRTWVSLNTEPLKIKGFLYHTNDSSILVSNSKVIQEYSTERYEIAELHYNNIETIKARRNNNIGRGVLIGTLSGFAFGGLLGLVSGDDPPDTLWPWTAGEKAIVYGSSLAVCGAGIGGGIGLIKVTIPINGSFNNYNRNKTRLQEYSMKKN